MIQPYFVSLSLYRINSQVDKKDEEEGCVEQYEGHRQGKKDMDDLDSDDEYDDDNSSDLGNEDDADEGEDFDHYVSKKTKKKSDVIPDVSHVNVED